jgi:hypothetical protein
VFFNNLSFSKSRPRPREDSPRGGSTDASGVGEACARRDANRRDRVAAGGFEFFEAGVAQLVESNVANVKVAGSRPAFRSIDHDERVVVVARQKLFGTRSICAVVMLKRKGKPGMWQSGQLRQTVNLLPIRASVVQIHPYPPSNHLYSC